MGLDQLWAEVGIVGIVLLRCLVYHLILHHAQRGVVLARGVVPVILNFGGFPLASGPGCSSITLQ